MKTLPRQHISNKYNTCTTVTSPVYTRSQEYGKELSIEIQSNLNGSKELNIEMSKVKMVDCLFFLNEMCHMKVSL